MHYICACPRSRHIIKHTKREKGQIYKIDNEVHQSKIELKMSWQNTKNDQMIKQQLTKQNTKP